MALRIHPGMHAIVTGRAVALTILFASALAGCGSATHSAAAGTYRFPVALVTSAGLPTMTGS